MSAVMLALAFVSAAGAAVLLVRLRRSGGRSDPGCGRCAYSVRGLPTFTCPECGSDLREVGIVRRGLSPRRRGLRVVAIVALSLLAAFSMLNFVRRQASLAQAQSAQVYQVARPKSITPVTAQPAPSGGIRLVPASGQAVTLPAGRAKVPPQRDPPAVESVPSPAPPTNVNDNRDPE